MNRVARVILFLIGAGGLAAVLALAMARLPGPEPARSRYADATNAMTVPQRHVSNAVAAVNFDFRGFDTLGEEFILFVSVLGALVLLREGHEKPSAGVLLDAASAGRAEPPSETIRSWALWMLGPKVLFGAYMIAHGALTPGGGFQGGVILATVPLIFYLGTDFRTFRKIVSFHAVEIIEAAGILLFVVVGLIGLVRWGAYLGNALTLGTPGQITAGGTIPLINLGTAMEVAAGFTLLLYVFLQDTLTPEEQSE
ncbi:MAG: hydrogen gas-evolving membrane-bound hydrogenase subunit E [Tepidisphaeraceae bacterium]